LPSRLASTQQDVLLGLNMSIDANKLLQSKMLLVNKNALSIAATLNVNEGNIQNVVKVFGIHPRLIKVAKVR
jgi:hypothetical protein